MEKKIRVLMVDDEERFRETTGKMLSKKGYETTMAGSGEEAIDIIKKTPHDVVILDIKMPGMGGDEALSEIKKIRPATQVIMLTGHGAEESAKEALVRGAYDYLTKPCDINLLAAKINSAHAATLQKEVKREKCAGEVMIPIDDYSSTSEESTVREALQQLKQSFESFVSTSRVMETGHRSLLVFNKNRDLVGILSIRDLLAAVRPAYLSATKPSMADAIRYSPMFWTGLFTTQAKALAKQKVGDIMSEPPLEVDADTNLMEVANLMYTQHRRRLVVTSKGEIVGVLREQELFFELAEIILERS